MSVFIGTSGWSYRHWDGAFYPQDVPQKNWLEFYAERFQTVELNNSFYHLPKDTTFRNWRERTPDAFVFAVKANRYLTHILKLKNCREPLENFFSAASRLKEKLGPVLFQLPKSFRADNASLDEFLQNARLVAGKKSRFALEVRNDSWLTDETFNVLRKHKAALVFADWGQFVTSQPVTADFVYVRRHGPADWQRPYNSDQLKSLAGEITGWKKNGLDVYAYFNNDYAGYAVKNAEELISLVAAKG